MFIICCVTVVYFLSNRYEPRIYKRHCAVVLILDTQYAVIMSLDNLVSIVIRLRAGPNHVGGKSVSFLQSVAYRPPVGTSQSPIQIVIVRYFPGGRAAGI
jgi:hypothetical protein